MSTERAARRLAEQVLRMKAPLRAGRVFSDEAHAIAAHFARAERFAGITEEELSTDLLKPLRQR